MENKTIQGRRENICKGTGVARDEVAYKRLQLKENLELINKILRVMKKRRKTIFCLTYLKSNWKDSDYITNELNVVKKSLRDYSTCYKITILKRKLLKNEFKQAQRKLAKKLKRLEDFDKKYFPES